MKVGIIGAGITGLTAACELLKSGHEVVVIESDKQLGGLAGVVKLEENYVERYYHHFFKTDTELISLLDELELSDKIFWLESQIGYYVSYLNYGEHQPLGCEKHGSFPY